MDMIMSKVLLKSNIQQRSTSTGIDVDELNDESSVRRGRASKSSQQAF